MYQPDEIVTLTAARGGWQGVISKVTSVGDKTAYLVHALKYEVYSRIVDVVLAEDIESSQGFSYPNWQVGDEVVIYDWQGTITAINDTDYIVEIKQPRKELYYTQIRTHKVPRWRLLIENNE